MAAILGLSPWKTAYDVYLDKIGEGVQDDKPHLAIGNKAQHYVLRKYEQAYETVVEQEDIEIIHPTHPFLIGNVDGIAQGGKTFVEAKTTSKSQQDWDYQIPPYYKTQVAFYAALGNPDLVDMPIAFRFNYGNNPTFEICDFSVLTYWRDLQFEKAVLDAAIEFWEECVLKRKHPEIKSFSDVKKRYGQSLSTALIATPEVKETIQKLQDKMEVQKQIDQEVDDLKLNLEKVAGDNSVITDEGGRYLVLFKTQERTSLDSKKLKEEQPDVFTQYLRTITTRPFKLLRSA